MSTDGDIPGSATPGGDEGSYARIAAAFHARIDCIAGAVDDLAPGIRDAAELLTQAVLEDRKVLVCARGADAALATLLAGALRDGRDGAPGLPALALADPGDGGGGEALWRDLRTLARDGDVVLCMDTADGAPLARDCASFAAARNLTVLTLSEATEAASRAAVVLSADSRELRTELLLMACHCLQAEIRHLLLGE